jgi:V8-like Glu-specific endopeptidase
VEAEEMNWAGIGIGPLPCCLVSTLVVLFGVVSSAKTTPIKRTFPGVIGEDGRRIVESVNPPWNAIGRVNIGGYRRTSHCTGTLIAPRLVVTATHCLVDKKSGKTHPLHNIHFLGGVKHGYYLAHGKADCVHFSKTYHHTKTNSLSRFQSDVAMVVLKEPLAIPPVSLVREISFDAGLPLQHASYSRDRRFLLTADSSCNLRGKKEGLWFTNCDTHFGSSGGPVFVQQDGKPVLAAIMVGAIQNKYSIAVPIGVWRDLASKETCQ